MLFLYPLVMQFLPSRKPGKRLKKARLPLSCISWWVWTTPSIADVNDLIPTLTKICDMVIHTFVVQAECDPIVCYISMVGCYKSCILQASHSSENRHFYRSAEKWACSSEVVQSQTSSIICIFNGILPYIKLHFELFKDDSSRDVTIFFCEMRHVRQKYNPLLRETLTSKSALEYISKISHCNVSPMCVPIGYSETIPDWFSS